MIIGDAHWREIVAAAWPYSPVDDLAAYRATESALADYLGFRIEPRSLLTDARARYRAIAKPAKELVTALHVSRRHLPRTAPDPLPDIQATLRILSWAEASLELTEVLLGARRGRRSPEREFLLWRLALVWQKEFRGKLAISTAAGGGPPGGPFIRFIKTTTREVIDPPLSPDAIRNFVRRERRAKGLSTRRK